MRSQVLRTATRMLQPLLILFSVYLLLTGHNAPGGGFTGGLLASAAFALDAIAFGPETARRALHFETRSLIGAGLLLALGSACGGLLVSRPLMTGLWFAVRVPGLGELDLGTPLLFDIGVYLVVLGVTLSFVFLLAEEEV